MYRYFNIEDKSKHEKVYIAILILPSTTSIHPAHLQDLQMVTTGVFKSVILCDQNILSHLDHLLQYPSDIQSWSQVVYYLYTAARRGLLKCKLFYHPQLQNCPGLSTAPCGKSDFVSFSGTILCHNNTHTIL